MASPDSNLTSTLLGGGSAHERTISFPDTVELAARTNKQQAIGDRRRGHADLPHPVGGQQLVFIARLEDVHIAVFTGEVDLAAGGHG